MTSNPRYEPLFDVHPRTGASIEIFYANRALETFGRCGAGWFWWPRRRGFSPEGLPIGPWVELLKADKRAFFTACSQASKAADYLRGLALAEAADIAA